MSEKIVQVNEEIIKSELKELVRGSVEETLNELLEKEAESLTQAARYECSEARQGYRSGHYDRSLTTTSGDVTLHVPRLKGVSFETAIIERYRRRESSVEEALIEMYLAGVSVRRVEDITEALWDSKVSPATISELNKKAYVHIEDWRNRPLQGGRYPYVYVDGIYLRRNRGGEYENVAVLVEIAVNEDGFREVFRCCRGDEGGQGQLGQLLTVASRTRSGRREAYRRRQVSGDAGGRGRGVPGCQIPALHGAFLPQRFLRCAKIQGQNCGKMLKAIYAQESKKASHESDAFMQSKIQNRQTSARFADFGTPEGTRTPNPQNRNLMLYPLSHWRICSKYYSRTLQQCKAFILIYRKKRRAEICPTFGAAIIPLRPSWRPR